MSKPSTKRAATEVTENPDVAIVKKATAPKLSPRGEGGIDYEVGRVGNDVYVRIEKNHGGGSCSKEWVPAEKIRAAITPAMRSGEPFKSDALASAYVGKSQCNSGFLVATLRAEGLLQPDAEHKGMSRLAGDLAAWVLGMREAAPLLGDDGQPLTAKLHPEPKETRFRPKQAEPDAEAGETPGSESAPGQDAQPSEEGEGEGEQKPILRKGRRVKRQEDGEPEPSEPEAADESTA